MTAFDRAIANSVIPEEAEPQPDRRHKFLTSRRYPIYCLTIAKSGCTFLKNLFYFLDHGDVHRRAEFIHDHPEDLIRAGDVPGWMIKDSRYAFTVLRHPVARFLSMYFDKIYGTGPQNFGPLRHEIANEAGLDLSVGLDALGHRDNCFRLIRWLSRNLADETAIPINPHWRPQAWRLTTVAHYKLGTFTLEGIDWQLPQYFETLIPDLATKMAAVGVRNTTHYPVPTKDVLDPALTEVIEAVYAEDLAAWRRCHFGWEKRKSWPRATPAIRTGHVINTLSTWRYRLNAIVQPKAGCTYVRNVFYALDHGRSHADPGKIEADRCLRYCEHNAASLEKELSFVVIRDPVARFFSLYFDKVWGQGDQAFPWLARRLLMNRNFRIGREIGVAEHRQNCRRLLRLIESEMAENHPDDLNPHWRPQAPKAERALSLGMTPILLEHFVPDLRALARDQIRGLDRALALAQYRNESSKPVPPSELLDDWLTEQLSNLYGADMDLYDRLRTEREARKASEDGDLWQDAEKDAQSTAG